MILVVPVVSASACEVFAQTRSVNSSTRNSTREATSPDPYHEGVKARIEGRCRDTIRLLVPIARRGLGFERAQHTLGLCLIEETGIMLTTDKIISASQIQNGTTAATVDLLPRAMPSLEKPQVKPAEILKNPGFQRGVDWIVTAANAGDFKAQASLIALFNIGLGVSTDSIEAAKWVHLYLTNPKRLTFGAPIAAANAINTLQAATHPDDWLRGKERARNWTPTYLVAPPPKKGDNKPRTITR